jgi:cytochrome d ubiquinol oxidase subunit I
LRAGDTVWYALARRWSQAFSILFVVGAVSGTALSFEFGLLWPRFMGYASGVIGLPFALEGFAFFTEGIFLGLYLYGWDRLSARAHWLCTIPIAVAGTVSAFTVVTANAWMNAPVGFRASDGKVVSVDPIAAMFNPYTPSETVHTILACYQVSAFAVAAVYAVALLRGHRESYYKRGLLLPMLFGTIVAPVQAFIGDLSARTVAQLQPAKLAAMEGLFHTTTGAPETILGFSNPATQQVYFAIRIPKLLSFLAYLRYRGHLDRLSDRLRRRLDGALYTGRAGAGWDHLAWRCVRISLPVRAASWYRQRLGSHLQHREYNHAVPAGYHRGRYRQRRYPCPH